MWNDAAGQASPDVSDVEEEPFGIDPGAAAMEPDACAADDCKRDLSSQFANAAVCKDDALQLVPAGDHDSGREAAQDASAVLAKLDVLVEAATDCQQQRLVSLAKRARQQAHKELLGCAKDDPSVVRAVMEAEDAITRKRQKKRVVLAAKKRKVQQLEDQRLRNEEMKKLLRDEKRKCREDRVDDLRQLAIDASQLELDTSSFSAKVNGPQTAVANRWRAFDRIFQLAELDPSFLVNLKREWKKWDSSENHRKSIGKPTDSEAYAIHYMKVMQAITKWSGSEKHKIEAWWKKEKTEKVPSAELILPKP